mgnify:CR=1 FL=1
MHDDASFVGEALKLVYVRLETGVRSLDGREVVFGIADLQPQVEPPTDQET